MKRAFHELSDYEKSDVADDLMLPTGVFGALLIAGLMCLALVWHPNLFANRAAAPPAVSMAFRSGDPSAVAKAMHLSGRQPSQHTIAAE